MDAASMIAFNAALLAAMASPGPALLVALRATLTGGSGAGIATGAGLGLVAAAWTLAALLGLEIVFDLFPWAYAVLKTAGAAYLIWIAVQTWRHAYAPINHANVPPGRAFVGGMLVNLGNPKSVIFAAAVLVVIFPPDLTPTEKLAIAGNHLAVEVVVYAALATLLGRDAVRARYLSLKPMLDRASSVVLAGLGLRLLTDR